MPELPDLAGFQKVLEREAIGKTVRKVSVPDDRILTDLSPQQLGQHFKGKKLTASRRHGKYLFAERADGAALVMHFGMTGELAGGDQDDELPEYAKLVIDFNDPSRLTYLCSRMLGQIAFTDNVDSYIEDAELGPDAMSDDLADERFVELLSGYQGTLKSALMNQELIAGIGNVWSDEILFHAGWRPDLEAKKLTKKELVEVYKTMREVLHDGSAEFKQGHELPDRFLVQHRDPGAKCPKCNHQVQHADVAGRRAYYCKHCQSKTGND